MSSHTLEGKKKTQNGVKRLAFTVLSILLEDVNLLSGVTTVANLAAGSIGIS